MRSRCVILLLVTATATLHSGEQDLVNKDLAAMQGAWAVEAVEYNGKDIKERYKFSFTFKGDAVTVEGDAGVKKEYATLKFKLDPSTNPKCLDIVVAAGIQKDVVMEGVYEVKGDSLRLCVKVFGNDRPNEFKSPNGSSIVFVTLKRAK